MNYIKSLNFLPYFPLEMTRKEGYKGVLYINFKKNDKNLFAVSDKLLDYLKTHRNEIDLIFLNKIFALYIFIFFKKLKKLNIPYILIPHGTYSPILFKRSFLKKKLYFNLFEKKVINEAFVLQVPSEFQFGYIKKIFSPKNLLAISTSIYFSRFYNEFFEEKEEDNNIKFVFWERKDISVKRLDLLIDSFSMTIIEAMSVKLPIIITQNIGVAEYIKKQTLIFLVRVM